MEEIIENIKKIIEDVADVPCDEITKDSSIMDDINLSSLEVLAVISEAEHMYSIKIPESEILSVATVGELAKLIEDKIQ